MLGLSDTALRHPLAVLALVGLTTLVAGAGVLRLRVRTDGWILLQSGAPRSMAWQRDRLVFDDPHVAILLVEGRAGARLDTIEGFRAIQSLHQSVEGLLRCCHVVVRSVANLVEPPPRLDSLAVHEFILPLPATRDELADVQRRLSSHPLLEGLFLSKDRRSAAMYVFVRADRDREPTIARIEEDLESLDSGPLHVQLTGQLAAEVELGRLVLLDVLRLAPLIALVIAGLVLLHFRRPGPLLVVLSEIAGVLLWTFGLMGWTGSPITLTTSFMPVVLLTMAVVDEIHILERVEMHRTRSTSAGPDSMRLAVARALLDVHRPVVATSLTTAVGLLSFCFASIWGIRDFGLFSALGILIAMLMSFTLVPALIAVLPTSFFGLRTQALRASPRVPGGTSSRGLRTGAIVGLVLALVLSGLARVRIQDSWLRNFDPKSPLVEAASQFDRAFWGAYSLDVVLANPELHFFEKPDGLRLVERLVDSCRGLDHVGGIVTHLAAFDLFGDRLGLATSASAMPKTTLERMARFLWLVEERIDHRRFLRRDGRMARAQIMIQSADYATAATLEQTVGARLERLTRGTATRFHLSGSVVVLVESIGRIVRDNCRSILFTLIGTAIVIGFCLGSVRLALVASAPPAIAIAFVIAMMGHLGISLGVASSMFAALSIGCGVDFAIHFAVAYEWHRGAGADAETAVQRSGSDTFPAIRWNGIVLTCGFLVLCLSRLPPNRELGLLLAVSAAAALQATTWAVPALVCRFGEPGPLRAPWASASPARSRLDELSSTPAKGEDARKAEGRHEQHDHESRRGGDTR